MEIEKKLATFPAYQGFILTPETETITLINPFKLNYGNNDKVKLFRHDTNRWTNVRGNPERYREIDHTTKMEESGYTFQIRLYRVWQPMPGQENETFAFYTDTSKSPKGCFLRIGDLRARLQGDPSDIEKLYKEDWDKEDHNTICIPVWPINGGKAGREQFSWIKRAKRNFVKQYTIHCNIAQRASVSVVEGWSPHLRYWDEGHPDLKVNFLILVNETICDREMVELHVRDITENYNIRFKPRECPVLCEGAVDLREVEKAYALLSEHILGFYKTYVLETHLPNLDIRRVVFRNRVIGFPIPNKINKIHDKFKESNIPAVAPTETKVTRVKILGARQIFRKPQQATVMNKLATSTIASAFWGTGSDAKKFRGATEWLHRSAFGFGGLGGDGVHPKSSQAMENLVFGTHEANTCMLRFEASIKNLTIHEDKLTGDKAQSMVFTRLQFPDFWDGRPEYFWCAPRLDYRWVFQCTPLNGEELVGSQNINLFGLRPPTRFEAHLDELIEDELYAADKTPPVAIEESPDLIDALQDALQADVVTYVATGSGPQGEDGEE